MTGESTTVYQALSEFSTISMIECALPNGVLILRTSNLECAAEMTAFHLSKLRSAALLRLAICKSIRLSIVLA